MSTNPLEGKNNLSIQNAPKPEIEKKLGLISHQKFINRTFYLSALAINAIDNLSKRLSRKAGIKISKSQTLEIIIGYAKDKSLDELLPGDKEDKEKTKNEI